jgi:hypothetical protein
MIRDADNAILISRKTFIQILTVEYITAFGAPLRLHHQAVVPLSRRCIAVNSVLIANLTLK